MTEKAFSNLLKGNQVRFQKPNAYIKDCLGVSLRTAQTYMNNPSRMSVNDFQIVIKELKVAAEDVLDFLKR